MYISVWLDWWRFLERFSVFSVILLRIQTLHLMMEELKSSCVLFLLGCCIRGIWNLWWISCLACRSVKVIFCDLLNKIRIYFQHLRIRQNIYANSDIFQFKTTSSFVRYFNMILLIREGAERKFPWPLAKVAFWLVLLLFSIVLLI